MTQAMKRGLLVFSIHKYSSFWLTWHQQMTML